MVKGHTMNYDSNYYLEELTNGLDTDDMTTVRVALVELLRMGYKGNHAEDFNPYKHKIIKMLLEYLKAEMFTHTKAFIWQLNQLGIIWPDLDIINDAATAAKKN